MNPPTPPSSLPPSPKRERLGSIDDMKKAYEQQSVKVPDSLPTPPHHGPESMDDIAAIRLMPLTLCDALVLGAVQKRSVVAGSSSLFVHCRILTDH